MKRGSIMLETVLVMPVLLMLIFAVIQFAHIWTARQMVAYAAFCASRAAMVVHAERGDGANSEQWNAAQKAAEIALSWINLCDGLDDDNDEVTIPGWGEVLGSGTSRTSRGGYFDKNGRQCRWNGKRVCVSVLTNGVDDAVVMTEVHFRFPLVIPGMAVNKIIGERIGGINRGLVGGSRVNFYGDLVQATANVDTIDGWPYIELTETCALPMPYSTARFPRNAFTGKNHVNIRKKIR